MPVAAGKKLSTVGIFLKPNAKLFVLSIKYQTCSAKLFHSKGQKYCAPGSRILFRNQETEAASK